MSDTFTLYPKLVDALSRNSESGRPLYELIVPTRPIVDDMSDVPDDAEFVATRGNAPNINRIAELQQLIAVWANPASVPFFRAAARAPKLRALYAAWFRQISEVPIAGADALEHLLLSYATRLVDLSFLRELPSLRTLYLDDMKRLDLETIPELPHLTGLALGGGIWSTMRVKSLAPLTRLPNLRYVRIVSLRTTDESLQPLAQLQRLEELNLPNYGPMEEFARLAGALPRTRSNVMTPFFTLINAGVAREITSTCSRCGGLRRMMTGKPAVHLCEECDRAKIEKRIARWEVARSAGWQ